MSFFKDFKEDLSQAVNELLPEEKNEPVNDFMAESPQMVDTITEDEPAFDKDEIANMLKNIDTTPAEGHIETFENHTFEKEPLEREYMLEESLFTGVSDSFYTTAQQEEESKKAEMTEEPEMQKMDEPEMLEKEESMTQETEKSAEEEIAEPARSVFEEMNTYFEKAEDPKEEERFLTPIFAQEPAERPAPINTTMEDFSMETGVIIAGMLVKGDVASEGNLDVMGTVTGNVEVKGKLEITGVIEGNSKAEEVFADGAKIVGEINSSGSVKIGQSSVVKGNIIAKSAVLAGAVKGDIDVQGPVILDTTAIIMGNIKSKSIQINNGAVIEGLCSQCYADVSPMTFFDDDQEAKEAKTKKA